MSTLSNENLDSRQKTILGAILNEEKSFSDLVDILSSKMSKQTLSKNLRILEEKKLIVRIIDTSKRPSRVYYKLYDKNSIQDSDIGKVVVQKQSINLGLLSEIEKIKPVIDESWALLESSRNLSEDRKENLEHIRKNLIEIRDSNSYEKNAIEYLYKSEISSLDKIYYLEKGIRELKEARDLAKQYLSDEDELYLDLKLLEEELNLYLILYDVLQRKELLDDMIKRSDDIFKKVNNVNREKMLGFHLLYAEILKEEALVTINALERHSLCEKSEKILLDIINEIEQIPLPNNYLSNSIIGKSHRHLAVIYELLGDDEIPGSTQKKYFELWRSHSLQSVKYLELVGECRTKAYALMNAASACNRLNKWNIFNSEENNMMKNSLDYLQQCIKILEKFDDKRGIGWAYIHACESIQNMIEMEHEITNRKRLLDELEHYAVNSVNNLLNVGDHLAKGLSHNQLAVAYSSNVDVDDPIDTEIKLNMAIRENNRGIELLEKTGYGRGLAKIYYDQSMIQFQLSEISKKEQNLVLVKSLFNLIKSLEILTTRVSIDARELIKIHDQLKAFIDEYF